MAVPDADRPQANIWLMFLAGMEPLFVLQPVGKLTPNTGQAQLEGRTSPDLRFKSGRGGATAPPQHPSLKLQVLFSGLPIRNDAVGGRRFPYRRFGALANPLSPVWKPATTVRWQTRQREFVVHLHRFGYGYSQYFRVCSR